MAKTRSVVRKLKKVKDEIVNDLGKLAIKHKVTVRVGNDPTFFRDEYPERHLRVTIDFES